LTSLTAMPSNVHSPSLRVLVVDDEPSIREILADYLGNLRGHRISTAGDGPDALSQFEPGVWDCVFLDLKMPGMDGVEVLVRLKQQEPSLPVVIMTGFPSLDAAIEAMRRGANDFLVKPIKLDLVGATLRRVVRERDLLSENLRLGALVKQQRKIGRLNRELEQRVRQLRKVQEISAGMDRLQNPEDLYQGVAEMARRHLDADKAAIMLLEPDSGRLKVTAVAGFGEGSLGRIAGVRGEGIIGKVALAGLPLMGNPEPGRPSGDLLGTNGSYLCLPITLHQETFGVMLVGDKRGDLPFRGEDLFLANFILQKAALSMENITLSQAMADNLRSTLNALVGAMEAKDPYIRQHSRRVTDLSVAGAEALGMESSQVEALSFAGYLHDIGKIGVKDNVLLKNTSLDPEEYEEVKRHPVLGDSIVSSMQLTPDERNVVLLHHERWDGGGYPRGLAGEEIPLVARVTAVADAFDAMTSDRSYRPSKSQEQAAGELRRFAGSQFDPRVVEAFLGMLKNYQEPEQEPSRRLGPPEMLRRVVMKGGMES
jgi:response regulator RpfG family c-di-GMP phosphodiesterase